jgi:hypothetical protein
MSSGWFDFTKPSLTTSLEGKQGVMPQSQNFSKSKSGSSELLQNSLEDRSSYKTIDSSEQAGLSFLHVERPRPITSCTRVHRSLHVYVKYSTAHCAYVLMTSIDALHVVVKNVSDLP